MNTLSLCQNVMQWMQSQQIKVPRDWVEACLDWLESENQMQNQNTVQIQKSVYEQWLMSDISELATACLPQEVCDETFTLTGIYCVQVNSVLDISQPYYSQLMTIQHLDNPNHKVSAETQVTQKPWEPKVSRVLMMKLTDGVKEVSGMEYRCISCLNENMAPGCKIRIKGPVNCRRGVLMLAASNVEFLGGEVEELTLTNNREAILCRLLHRPLPTRPSDQPTVDQQLQERNNNTGDNVNLPDDLISQLTDDTFVTEPDSGYGSGRTSSIAAPRQHPAGFQSDTDDLIDLEVLQEIERMETQQTRSDISRTSPVLTSGTDEPNRSVDVNLDADLWADATDEILLQPEIVDLTSSSDFNIPDEDTRGCHSYRKQLSIEDSFKQNYKPLSKNLQRYADRNICSTGNTTVKLKRHANDVTAKKGFGSNNPSRLSDDDFITTNIDERNDAIPPKSAVSFEKNIGITRSAMTSGLLDSPATPKDDQDFQIPTLFSRIKHREKSNKLPLNSPSVVPSKTEGFRNGSTKSSLSFAKPATQDREGSNFQFSSLCMARCCRSISRHVITVKACVVTLLSKLQGDEGRGWSLKASICDGTDVLQVMFSDEVLTELIGFTSDQAETVKAGGDTSALTSLRAGMLRCRENIIEMCKLMTIEYDGSPDSLPTIKKLSECKEDYWKAVTERTQS